MLQKGKKYLVEKWNSGNKSHSGYLEMEVMDSSSDKYKISLSQNTFWLEKNKIGYSMGNNTSGTFIQIHSTIQNESSNNGKKLLLD